MRKNPFLTRFKHASRGFTLMELVVYMMIFAVVTGAMLMSFYFFKKAYWKTASSYDIQKEIPIAVDWLKKDLMNSSLSSIRVFPTTTARTEVPGLSFISSMQPEVDLTSGGNSNLQMSQYGTPQWTKYVFYTLQPNSFDASDTHSPRSARLVRWEMKLASPQAVPIPTTILPSAFASQSAAPRTIIKELLVQKSPRITGFDSLKLNNLDYGGFRVTFVQKKPMNGGTTVALSDTNPSMVQDAIGGNGVPVTSYNTELVQVDLIALLVSETTGKPTAYAVEFQVKPRN